MFKKSCVLLCLLTIFFFSSGSKLDDQTAKEALVTSIDSNDLEILGISMETEELVAAKLKVGENQIIDKRKKYDRGWLFEEVKSTTGEWISADAYANILEMDKEKIKQAKAEIETLSIIISCYKNNYGSLPQLNGKYLDNDDFCKKMVPFFVAALPDNDPWGNEYLIYTKENCKGKYGIEEVSNMDFLIVSFGEDGEAETSDDFVMHNGNWLEDHAGN